MHGLLLLLLDRLLLSLELFLLVAAVSCAWRA